MSLTDKQRELIALIKVTVTKADDATALEDKDWYPEWVYKEKVEIGDIRRYNDKLYKVHNHAGDNLYPPDQVPAVWNEISLEEWPEWKQPAGAHDSYSKGSKVTHNGKKWTSDVDNNTWEPGVYGWTEFVEK